MRISERGRVMVAVLAWAAVMAVSFAWGAWLSAHGHRFRLGTPPLYGRFVPRASIFALPALGLALLALTLGPRWAERSRWPWVVIGGGVASGAWGAALASIDGIRGLRVTNRLRSDFITSVPMVHDPASLLRRFTRDLASFSVHVHGHPPGLLLLLWAMDRAKMGGARWETALELVGFALAVAAVLVGLREVAGEEAARRAAPFLVFAPYAAQGIAITADAVFAALSGWGVVLVLMALRRSSEGLALVGGLLFGLALYFTYGAVLLALVPLAVALGLRQGRALLVAAGGVAAVVIGFLAFRFWWVSGLLQTWHVIASGARKYRVAGYFWFGNLGAFATTMGPATAAGLARLRDRRVWWLVGGAAAAVALADMSQLSRAEVERIWLPMAIWLAVAACAHGRGRRPSAAWLAAHVASALAVAFTIRATW